MNRDIAQLCLYVLFSNLHFFNFQNCASKVDPYEAALDEALDTLVPFVLESTIVDLGTDRDDEVFYRILQHRINLSLL